MANYSITYACGHAEDKQLYGKHAARDSYITWAASHGVCSRWKSTDAAATLAAVEAEHHLATLSGSDKQIAWARSIRSPQVTAVAAFVAKTRAGCPADKLAAFEAQADAVMTALASKTEARWWIDARETTAGLLAARAYKEATK